VCVGGGGGFVGKLKGKNRATATKSAGHRHRFREILGESKKK